VQQYLLKFTEQYLQAKHKAPVYSKVLHVDTVDSESVVFIQNRLCDLATLMGLWYRLVFKIQQVSYYT